MINFWMPKAPKKKPLKIIFFFCEEMEMTACILTEDLTGLDCPHRLSRVASTQALLPVMVRENCSTSVVG